jgi:hypothetical protein
VPSEGVRDAPSYEVTPRASKGALGIWRALDGAGLWAGIDRSIKAGPSPACKRVSGGVYMSQHLSFLGAGKAAGGHARVRTLLGKSDRSGSQGGLRKRGLWWKLNGHVPRKR